MAYRPPVLNLACNIYTGPWHTRALRIADEPCNLALGKGVRLASADGFSNDFAFLMTLYLGAGVDVRSSMNGYIEDLVECPAGSSRWYQVIAVDDSGKGFPNESRVALLHPISEVVDPVDFAGLFWPTPIP